MARFWFRQILNVSFVLFGHVFSLSPNQTLIDYLIFLKPHVLSISSTLANHEGSSSFTKMGVSHRDLSLENVLIDHNMSKAVIIDLGMCLPVPFGADDGSIVDVTKGTLRRLMLPQGQCGKPSCMPPEILLNDKPFDGFAIDVWVSDPSAAKARGNLLLTPTAKGQRHKLVTGSIPSVVSFRAASAVHHSTRYRFFVGRCRDKCRREGPEPSPSSNRRPRTTTEDLLFAETVAASIASW